MIGQFAAMKTSIGASWLREFAHHVRRGVGEEPGVGPIERSVFPMMERATGSIAMNSKKRTAVVIMDASRPSINS